MTTTDAVTFEAVSKSYGSVRVLDGMDLTIHSGQTVALLGPNGAGKSTAISLLLGLESAERGSVRLFDGPPRRAVESARVGAMLQDGKLPTGVRVGELLTLMRALYPNPVPMPELVAMAGVGDIIDRSVSKLSGGQTQRVRFGLAIAGSPDLLILDEPTAAMDVTARKAFWASIRTFTEGGRTVLFCTHYLEEADDFADRIIMMADGKVAADGTSAQLKRGASGRIVSFRLGTDTSAGLDTLPGVTAVEIRAERAILRSTDADATVAALFGTRGPVSDLTITDASIDDAFVALTSTGVSA